MLYLRHVKNDDRIQNISLLRDRWYEGGKFRFFNNNLRYHLHKFQVFNLSFARIHRWLWITFIRKLFVSNGNWICRKKISCDENIFSTIKLLGTRHSDMFHRLMILKPFGEVAKRCSQYGCSAWFDLNEQKKIVFFLKPIKSKCTW